MGRTKKNAQQPMDLTDGLSTGEKEGTYILNILFEMEERKQTKRDTLFVFDDIADSFDYQNKYAIVQYLKEISRGAVFQDANPDSQF